MNTGCCDICRYSKQDMVRPMECRRYPPTVNYYEQDVNGQYHTYKFPVVNRGEWCGEFKQKEE